MNDQKAMHDKSWLIQRLHHKSVGKRVTRSLLLDNRTQDEWKKKETRKGGE